MPLTLLDFVQQVDNVTVDDIPDSTQDSINAELNQQTGGDGGGTDISNPSDARIVAEVAGDNSGESNLNGRAGFTSIQDAIDGTNGRNEASNEAIKEDGTIFVEPGTYNESVTLSTSGVTIQSTQGSAETTINGDGVNSGSQPHAAIQVDDTSGSVQNVTIDGFTVQNPDGNFGIFAGDGSTNSKNDGISGLVISNNVIRNISTDVDDSALTGGPAGVGIRSDYGTDGKPGIVIEDNLIDNVENVAGAEPVGITLKSFTGNAGFGFNSSGDSTEDTASPPATDTDIIDNTIKNISSSDGGFATKGISVSGEFEDVLIEDNTLSNIESPGRVNVITLTENGGSFDGNEYDIDGDNKGERIGPRDFEIRDNTISSLSGGSEKAVFVGGYEDLDGDGSHAVTGNTINDGTVERFAGNQPGFQPGDEDALNTTGNTFTDTGTEIYYSDSSSGSDLGAVFDNNTFEPNIIVGDDLIVQPPASDNVRNIDQSATESSIQSAVNNADIGDTIAVGSGTFDETVDIGVDNLTLSGVLGDASSEVNEINIGQNGNSTATTGVTIRGFTIAPDSGIGIETTIEQDSDVTIEDNRIEGPAGSPAAAFFQNPAGIEIRDNQFVGPDPDNPTFDNTVGDLLVVGSGANDDGDNYSIVDNSFEGIVNRDQQPSGGNAIEVRTDGVVTIEDNDLTNVTSENGDLLFTASKSTNVTTNNNTGL